MPMNPEAETWYIALRKLLIPNGPGKIPSSCRVAAGERFALDGDEPIDIARLISQGAVRVYQATPEDAKLISEQEKEREAAARKPRMRRNR